MAKNSQTPAHKGDSLPLNAMQQETSSQKPSEIRIKDDPDDTIHLSPLFSGLEGHSPSPTSYRPTFMLNPGYRRQESEGFAMQDIANALDDPHSTFPSPESDTLSLDDNDSVFSYASLHGSLPPHEETEKYLRNTLGIAPPHAVNLTVLPEHPWPPGITRLIKLAIWGSQRKMLTLSQIYDEIETRFPAKSGKDASWKKSIRHNLSLKSVFVKVERPASHPGKGYYWALDFRRGDGDKRPRSRKTKELRSGGGVDPEDVHASSSPSRGPHTPYNRSRASPYASPHQLFGMRPPLPSPQAYYNSQTGSTVGQSGFDANLSPNYDVRAGPPLVTGPQMRWESTHPSQPVGMDPSVPLGMLFPSYSDPGIVAHGQGQGPYITYPYQSGHAFASRSAHSLQTTDETPPYFPLIRSHSFTRFEDTKESWKASRRHRTY